MKVSLTSTFMDKCGIATYTGYLTDALLKQKIKTFVFAEKNVCKEPFPFKSKYRFCWSRDNSFENIIKLSKKYDVNHIQHQFGLFPNIKNNVKLLEEMKHPIVTTMHDVVPLSTQTKNYVKPWLTHSDAIIVHTMDCLNILKQWQINEQKIHLVPHGTLLVEMPDKFESRIKLGIPFDKKVILSWGFIWESKGLNDLVTILAEIKKSFKNAMLIHAGGVHPIIQRSQYVKDMLKNAVKLGITPKDLVITNWVPEADVSKWFSVADVIVLNYSRGSASASGAAHRALAAHKPLVSTSDGCLDEIPALKVPALSPTDLYQAIVKVLDSESLQKELVEKADLAAKEMSWDVVAGLHRNIYFSF